MSFTEPLRIPSAGHRAKRQRSIAAAIAETLPTADEMRDSVMAVIAEASPDAEAEGLGWYGIAHDIADELAQTHGLTIRQTAGVIAALSPRTGWAENISLASDACAAAAEGRTDLIGGCPSDNARKASMILQGHDPADVLGGRKVRSFFANILRPYSAGPVTVDRHAISVAFGHRVSEEDAKLLERIGTYTVIASVYRSVARSLGIRPHQAQAIAWVAWRKLHGADILHDIDSEF